MDSKSVESLGWKRVESSAWMALTLAGVSMIGLVITLVVGVRTGGIRYVSMGHEERLKRLDEAAGSIRDAMIYLEEQKRIIEETRKAVEKLQAEREKLQPLVEADREVIRAIFDAQEQRRSVWWELFFAFFLGVLSSLAAQYTPVGVSRYLEHRRRRLSAQPPAASGETGAR